MTQVYGEAWRYALATIASAAASLLIPFALREGLGVAETIAVAISLCLVFLLNFFSTRVFVFRSKGDSRGEIARFAAMSLAFRGAEYVAFLFLNVVLGVQYLLALASVLCVSFCAKFLAQRRFVYRILASD